MAALGLALFVFCMGGCESAGSVLLINVRTDVVPVLEFRSVSVWVDGEVVATSVVDPADDYVRGTRVAELTGVAPSSVREVRVSLLDAAGQVVLAQSALVENIDDTAVTLVLQRSCRGVLCPPASDPNATQCRDGRCESPECEADNPDCTPRCERDADCDALSFCAAPRCVEGACFYEDRRLCGAGAACVPETGCQPIMSTLDGGAETDAAIVDAGDLDAGDLDAGGLDAGPVDAGMPDAGGGVESCDGTDEDDDTRIDEGVTRACSSACGGGIETCVGGTFMNCSARQPMAETCNNVDDNCDGTIDEGLLRTCSTACGTGTETCSLGSFTSCTAPPVPAESCNLFDDDCDGVCDNGVAGGCRRAIHRSFNATTGEHFYSQSLSEAGCCGFSVENANYFHLYRADGAGRRALYRCLLASGFHLLTTSASCEGSPGATNEGAQGFVGTAAACGSVPLYRLVLGNDHLYVTSTAARNAALGMGYASEGTTGHVWPSL
ncbi:MAG: hypothetical protein AB8I08_14005 [Sandaracinaceae bacterium]